MSYTHWGLSGIDTSQIYNKVQEYRNQVNLLRSKYDMLASQDGQLKDLKSNQQGGRNALWNSITQQYNIGTISVQELLTRLESIDDANLQGDLEALNSQTQLEIAHNAWEIAKDTIFKIEYSWNQFARTTADEGAKEAINAEINSLINRAQEETATKTQAIEQNAQMVADRFNLSYQKQKEERKQRYLKDEAAGAAAQELERQVSQAAITQQQQQTEALLMQQIRERAEADRQEELRRQTLQAQAEAQRRAEEALRQEQIQQEELRRHTLQAQAEAQRRAEESLQQEQLRQGVLRRQAEEQARQNQYLKEQTAIWETYVAWALQWLEKAQKNLPSQSASWNIWLQKFRNAQYNPGNAQNITEAEEALKQASEAVINLSEAINTTTQPATTSPANNQVNPVGLDPQGIPNETDARNYEYITVIEGDEETAGDYMAVVPETQEVQDQRILSKPTLEEKEPDTESKTDNSILAPIFILGLTLAGFLISEHFSNTLED
jgi:hypothetical protein